MVYTLKIESVSNDFMKAVQAFIQENKLWIYEVEMGCHSANVSLSTMSARELKRLVDILEAEEFMRDEQDFSEYLAEKYQ